MTPRRLAGARVFVAGGAGFIGSHVVGRLVAGPEVAAVTVYDNFSSGREWHLEGHDGDARLTVCKGDLNDLDGLREAMQGHDLVVHLASNPDVARAMAEPDVDFWEGTFLTHQVVEAMRTTGATDILYASGSGVYGDLGEEEIDEDHGPLVPISTYGASKLAGEALLASYCHLFGLRACAFRFGNVVGPRQTHGVAFDFVRRLLTDPSRLTVLGDGSQRKPYVHVADAVEAMLLALERAPAGFSAYNVAPDDAVSVREIAELALECLGLDRGTTALELGSEPRGWRGDVPVVRLRTERIRDLGWAARFSSREAVADALAAIQADARRGRL